MTRINWHRIVPLALCGVFWVGVARCAGAWS